MGSEQNRFPQQERERVCLLSFFSPFVIFRLNFLARWVLVSDLGFLSSNHLPAQIWVFSLINSWSDLEYPCTRTMLLHFVLGLIVNWTDLLFINHAAVVVWLLIIFTK